jgi:methylmalonyl-CoA mutase
VPVIGITGTGGAGKSSLTDELLRRFLLDHPTHERVAVFSVDPTRKRTGGALLGDRIRMNALDPDRVFMRSLATRAPQGRAVGAAATRSRLCAARRLRPRVRRDQRHRPGRRRDHRRRDVSLYVMTPEFGAPSQLEKIDMLDSPTSSRSTSSRSAAGSTPCATCASRCGATARSSTGPTTRCPCTAPWRRGSRIRG